MPVYPAGLAGAGLFVLRASTSLSLQIAVCHFSFPDWRHLAAASLAFGLMLGLKMRVLAGISVVLAISALPGRDNLMAMLPLILNACALALAGPGAYSVDARLSGRRTIILPARSDDRE